jgi:hypothetical protein
MTPKKVYFENFMKHDFLPIFDALQHRNKNFKMWNMRGRFAFLTPYLTNFERKKLLINKPNLLRNISML